MIDRFLLEKILSSILTVDDQTANLNRVKKNQSVDGGDGQRAMLMADYAAEMPMILRSCRSLPNWIMGDSLCETDDELD